MKLKNICLDFQLAIENALKITYSGCKVRFCLFHYSQTVYRKSKILKLDVKYRNDIYFRVCIKTLLCFVFTLEYDRNAYLRRFLRKFVASYLIKEVKDFLNYYHTNWYISSFFGDDDLYNRIILDIPFTNNGAGGFNLSLEKKLVQSNPANRHTFVSKIPQNLEIVPITRVCAD